MPPAGAPVACIIYDMDGLLLDTEPFYTQASQVIADRFGKVFDWSVKIRMIGKRAADSAVIFTRALDLPISPEQYLAERKVLLDELFPKARPLPGAVRLTRHLHRHGVPQAVATSSDRRNFSLKTTRHREWFELFRIIVKGDDPSITAGKPAPDIFLLAAERLGVAAERCLVFEDSPVGVEAGIAAGMRVIAVPDRHVDRSAFTRADQILDSLEQFDPAPWSLPPYDPEESRPAETGAAPCSRPTRR